MIFMAYALIACRSVTSTQRAIRILEKNNISASMRRLPAGLPDTSCGHAVRVRRDLLEQSIELMRQAGYPVKVFFCENEEGGVAVCP